MLIDSKYDEHSNYTQKSSTFKVCVGRNISMFCFEEKMTQFKLQILLTKKDLCNSRNFKCRDVED